MYNQEHKYYVEATKHMDGYDKTLYMRYDCNTGAITFVSDKDKATAFDNADSLGNFIEMHAGYVLSMLGVVGQLERVM
jgi:hypothetical protein